MPTKRATLQHLQVLQSARPLEAPPACLGATDPNLADLRPKDLFAGSEAASHDQLRETLHKAEFWISLLEGENCDLNDEVAKHKKRYQQALRQADNKAVELKEVEGEKKRLLSEIKWMRESRDQAICDRALLREDASRMTTQTKGESESAAKQAESLDAELHSLRSQKKSLEDQLVGVKVRAVDSMQKVDSMECLIEYYEDQLRAMDPKFEPVDIASVGQWMKPSRQDCDGDSVSSGTEEQQSVVSQEKPRAQQIARGLKTMLKKGGIFKPSKKRGSKQIDPHKQDECQTETPRETEEPCRQRYRPSTTPSPQPSPSPRLPTERRGGPSPQPSPRPWELPPVSARGAADEATGASPMPSEPDPALGADAGSSVVSASPPRAKKRWEMRREE